MMDTVKFGNLYLKNSLSLSGNFGKRAEISDCIFWVKKIFLFFILAEAQI